MVEVSCRPRPGSPSAQGVSRLVADAPRHLDHQDGNGPPRWSRCEPRAASLETDCAGAVFGPPRTGMLSAQGVSRLVAGAPQHLDHQDGNGPPAGRGASRVRRASRPTAPALDSDHCGPYTHRHNRSRGSSLSLLGTSTIGRGTVPPLVEVRAACGEPRDRLRRRCIRTTEDRIPIDTTGLEARR